MPAIKGKWQSFSSTHSSDTQELQQYVAWLDKCSKAVVAQKPKD